MELYSKQHSFPDLAKELNRSRTANHRSSRDLARDIIECERCPRLRAFARTEAKKKRPRFVHWDYWAKPVPGFGDINGEVLIVGLAPAATGALRTGRIFTGDASSKFLVSALYETGFANQPLSESVDDGLIYDGCYLTAAVKCAPPGDRPLPQEFENCSAFLDDEIRIMKNLRAVLALGSMAFNAYVGSLKRRGVPVKGVEFGHGKKYKMAGGPTLYASFHPSPRNTNTGKLTHAMLVRVLGSIAQDLEGRPGA